MSLCKCDCGNEASPGRQYISGHNTKGRVVSDETKDKLRAARLGRNFAGEGITHPSYKPDGGGFRHKRYVYVLVHPEHPYFEMAGRSGQSYYISEHRLVMAVYMGRALTKHETVHHKNGVRNDNRLSNLELWGRKHPPGQRIQDMLSWAHELIELYEGDVYNG